MSKVTCVINLQQEEFKAGDTVNGSLQVEIPHDIKKLDIGSKGIVVRLEAKEKGFFHRSNGKNIYKVSVGNIIFESSMVVCPEGHLTESRDFNFSFTLPKEAEAPPSFTSHFVEMLNFQDQMNINYKVKAVINVAGMLSSNIKSKREIHVKTHYESSAPSRPPQLPADLHEQRDEESNSMWVGLKQNVKLYRLKVFSHGSINISASTPSLYIHNGQSIPIKVQIENTGSDHIKSIKFVLKQRITAKTTKAIITHNLEAFNNICENTVMVDCPPGSTINQKGTLKIPPNAVTRPIRSLTVSNSYFLEIELPDLSYSDKIKFDIVDVYQPPHHLNTNDDKDDSYNVHDRLISHHQ